MPGTIQISVLEFKGLPAESSPSLLKVSLGKREYQTSDMNEFSFPLTTLRGDLVVALHDAEGNELAHLGIRTMSIVEKVSWDDYFPLDGESGYLHLKLKFMLSQQEQTRIRAMREAALKEKQVFTASALSARVDVASPSSSHAEQTVSVKKLDDSVQAGSLSNPVILYDIRQSDFAEEERSIPIKEITKDNDNREKAGSDPSGQEAEARHAKKIDTQSSIHRTPLKSGSSDIASSKQELPICIVASSSDSLNLKSVSKVKIIANAFESGLAKQDVKYTVSPAAVKPVGKKFLKGGNPKEIERTNSVEERDRSSGLVAEGSKLDNVRVNNETNVDDVESQATVRSKQSTSLVIDPRADNIDTEEKGMSAANSDTVSTRETACNSGAEQSPLIVTDPMVDDMNTEETGISTGYSNSDRSLTRETASTPGKKLDCSSENVHSFDLSTKKHCSINSSNAEEKGRKDPYATKFYRSNDESIPLEYREEDNLLIDKSEAKPHQDKKVSNIHGDPIKFVQHETAEEKETDSEESEDTKKPIPDSPSNDAWNGLVGQAGKIALIVGFGVLVFLTRQRQPRKTPKNEPGHNLFKPSEYMNDQVVLEAEKWIDS